MAEKKTAPLPERQGAATSVLDGAVSRRNFMKGFGGVIGATAVGPALMRASFAQAPLTREGVRKFPAAGQEYTLQVNGKPMKVTAPANATLLEVMREKGGLTGCKEVCNRGACGACTMLLDGRSVNSCMTLALDAIGHEVTTVEGLVGADGKMDPVQEAFCAHDACQCGYCIPGFVVRSRAFLNENKNPSLDDIKHGLSGNICRCAAYIRIFEAVGAAAKGGAA